MSPEQFHVTERFRSPGGWVTEWLWFEVHQYYLAGGRYRTKLHNRTRVAGIEGPYVDIGVVEPSGEVPNKSDKIAHLLAVHFSNEKNLLAFFTQIFKGIFDAS
jgi:hypothetical protein